MTSLQFSLLEILGKLAEDTDKAVDLTFMKFTGVSDEDITVIQTFAAIPREKVMLTTTHWWELYQTVRRVNLAVIADTAACEDVDYDTAVWADNMFEIDDLFMQHATILKDSSMDHTDLFEMEHAIADDNEAIMSHDRLMDRSTGTVIDVGVPFNLFHNYEWTFVGPADLSWVIPLGHMFMEITDPKDPLHRSNFPVIDFENPAHATGHECVISDLRNHLSEQLVAYFKTKVHEKSSEVVPVGHLRLKGLLYVMLHYFNTGVLLEHDPSVPATPRHLPAGYQAIFEHLIKVMGVPDDGQND